MDNAKYIGDKGEQVAADHLSANGYTIISRNWRHGRYELDIIAEKNGVLHFVEVKSRKTGGLTTSEEAMTRKKFLSLVKAAEKYIEINNICCEVMFDLAAVSYHRECWEVEYIEDAMNCQW